jgi:hypothetical protein
MLETTVPCLVKQPGQDDLKGVIQKDLGDRFSVYIPHLDKSITVSKLFVYPDFSKLDKCSRKKSDTSSISTDPKVIDSSAQCSRKITPTSKTRRTKGKGSGWIQCKPIKRSGKEYKQYWYNYEEWFSGDRLIKKSRYIPKRLLSRVEKMEAEKAAVREILVVLGVER